MVGGRGGKEREGRMRRRGEEEGRVEERGGREGKKGEVKHVDQDYTDKLDVLFKCH